MSLCLYHTNSRKSTFATWFSSQRLQQVQSGAGWTNSSNCYLLHVFSAGNRKKLAHIFHGLQQEIKINLGFPGKTTRSLHHQLWVRTPETSSCATKQDGSRAQQLWEVQVQCTNRKGNSWSWLLAIWEGITGGWRTLDRATFTCLLCTLGYKEHSTEQPGLWSFRIKDTSIILFKTESVCIHLCPSAEAQALNFRYHRVNS